MHTFHGSCHCGNIRVRYSTTTAPEAALVRACQCTFCRKQNARAVSDPAGQLAFFVRDDDQLSRYRFGMGTADYLVCRICGVSAGAYMPDPRDGSALGTVMVGVLDQEARFGEAQPMDYAGESEDEKRQRRRGRWTPARLAMGA